jgi:uncharacterized protein (DUF433 family)/predicted transcriptional regulator
MDEHIVFDGETGQPIVSSTRTPVDGILEAIDNTGTVDGALQRFPGLTAEGVSAALQFARRSSRRDTKYQSIPNYGVTVLRERGVQFNAGGAATLDPREEDDAAERRSVEDSFKAAEARREQLLYELDVVESIRDGLQDIIDGKTISHEEAVAWLRANIPG